MINFGLKYCFLLENRELLANHIALPNYFSRLMNNNTQCYCDKYGKIL